MVHLKGLAYTIEERKSFGLSGLLPPIVLTQQDQERLVLNNLNQLSNNLDKYVYLMHLLDR